MGGGQYWYTEVGTVMALQEDELCIVSAVEAILQATKAIEKIGKASFEALPTV